MKVALVCDWFHPRRGGIELHLHDLATRLMARDHDVVVITPTPGQAVVDGIRVVRIAARRAPHFGFLITPAGVRAIGDALAGERVDVAHCHVSIVSPAALGGASQAQRRGLPTVVTFHSVVPQTRLLARLARTLLGTARWPALFSAVSDRVARDVGGIARRGAMSILSNGIDVDFWRSSGSRLPGETFEMISVLRLNPKKRPLALADMMLRLARLVPGRRVRLRIVGDGPLRARLERAIARHELGDRIELLGHRTRAEIRELLWESDAFVLPAVRESFGLAALEARCAGLPVVAMQASGVAEVIRHDVEGLLAASDDGLSVHVASLITDRDRHTRIASHNRRVAPPHDWSVVLDAHEALYREAIALRDNACAE